MKKLIRIGKIKNFLRMQTSPVTITEIFEALNYRLQVKVSRKTIERDMIELSDAETVSSIPGTPTRFVLNRPVTVEVSLKVEELSLLLEKVDLDSELYIKIKKAFESL